jgi:ABC-2 type transport system ATP-binding protein
MEALIEAEGLTKAFGKVRALNGLSLTVPTGQAVAILGPNGAGKTTFIRMVATLLRPDSGTLRVGGCDVVKEPMAVRRMIGLAGQSAAVEEMMTGRENLTMVARLYGQGKKEAAASAKRILEQMDLTDAGGRMVKGYSGGMRRRLDLGASLVGAPRLLLLDEPTTGLDPGSRNEVWDGIRAMRQGGTDVVLTTQYLDEADHLADSIVIIDGGRVIAQGTSDELKSRVGADVVELHTGDVATLARAADVLRGLAGGSDGRGVGIGVGAPSVDEATRRCSVSAPAGSKLLTVVVRALDEAGVEVEDISLRRPTLDEVFLELTGRSAGAADGENGENGENEKNEKEGAAA